MLSATRAHAIRPALGDVNVGCDTQVTKNVQSGAFRYCQAGRAEQMIVGSGAREVSQLLSLADADANCPPCA